MTPVGWRVQNRPMAKASRKEKHREGLQTKYVAIDSLTEDPDNTRRHNKRNLSAIKGSLEQFGQVEPLVVQKGTGRVIGGNGRLSMLKELEQKTVAIVEVSVDDTQAKALSIALNRASDLAGWDEAALTRVLSELQDTGMNLEAVGFDETDLAKRFANLRELSTDGLPEAPTSGANDGNDARVASDHVRQVQLFMPSSTFEEFQSNVAALMAAFQTTNVTDTVVRAVAEALQAVEG